MGKNYILPPLFFTSTHLAEKMGFHYIYIIREREHVRSQEQIYKIGKTVQESAKRIKSYPKDSEGIVIEQVSNATQAEKQIIKEFKKKFTHRPDIGNEYFEGDRQTMKNVFREICDNFFNDDQNQEEHTSESSSLSGDLSPEEEMQAEIDVVSKEYQKNLLFLRTNKRFVQKINKVMTNLNYQITGDENDYVSLGNIAKEYAYVYPRSKEITHFDLDLDQVLKIMIWNEMFKKGKLRLYQSSGAVNEIEIQVLSDWHVSNHYPYNIAISGIKSNRVFTKYDKTNLVADVKKVAKISLSGCHKLEDFVDEPMKQKNLIKMLDFVEKRYIPRPVVGKSKSDLSDSNVMSLSQIQDDGGVYGRHISLAICLILGFTILPHCDPKKKRCLYSTDITFLFRDDYVSSLVRNCLKDEGSSGFCLSHKNKNCLICHPMMETTKLKGMKRWILVESRYSATDIEKQLIKPTKILYENWEWFSSTQGILKKKLVVHLKLKKEMKRILEILEFLIVEFELKKGLNETPHKFYLAKQTGEVYQKLCFHEHDWINDNPMSTFINCMNLLVCEDLGNEIKERGGDPEVIYYGRDKPDNLRIDYEEWKISENFQITSKDGLKLLEFKKLLISTLDGGINEYKKSPKQWENKQTLLSSLVSCRQRCDEIF